MKSERGTTVRSFPNLRCSTARDAFDLVDPSSLVHWLQRDTVVVDSCPSSSSPRRWYSFRIRSPLTPPLLLHHRWIPHPRSSSAVRHPRTILAVRQRRRTRYERTRPIPNRNFHDLSNHQGERRGGASILPRGGGERPTSRTTPSSYHWVPWPPPLSGPIDGDRTSPPIVPRRRTNVDHGRYVR